ncbi:MAG: preprotein translocase subunit YajC [Rhodospirillales bacterium]|nr:preprotein translocase subunit YajC [Rhodospirillales bacterium]
MFITPAYAQDAGGADVVMQFLPIVLIFVVFYFLLIRPQQKRAKEHRNMVANLRRGDRVVTGGGFVGQVSKVIDDNEVQVEIADGVRVRVVRSTITTVLDRSGAPPAAAPARRGSLFGSKKSDTQGGSAKGDK